MSNLSADTKELTSTGVLVEKGKSKCTFTLSHESDRSITSEALAADSYNFYFTCLDDADLSFDEAKAVSASYDFILATGMDYELSVIGYSGTNIISELETVCTLQH